MTRLSFRSALLALCFSSQVFAATVTVTSIDDTVAAGSNAYTVTGLDPHTWYYFRVRAVATSATLDSDFTDSIKLKTLKA